tara:strand:- start:169 stop:441 length:273 start_codon:yes stop_codon:yes gene_type:complete
VVVKEKRGRKRYVLFTHPKKLTRKEAYNLFDRSISKTETKIKWKIVRYDNETGVLLLDHRIASSTCETINNISKSIKTKKTSGTLKALDK